MNLQKCSLLGCWILGLTYSATPWFIINMVRAWRSARQKSTSAPSQNVFQNHPSGLSIMRGIHISSGSNDPWAPWHRHCFWKLSTSDGVTRVFLPSETATKSPSRGRTFNRILLGPNNPFSTASSIVSSKKLLDKQEFAFHCCRKCDWSPVRQCK